MNKVLNTVKKGLFSALALLTLVSPAAALADTTPRFNQLEGDREFIMGRNVTQNQTEYSDPVNAVDGDVVRVSFYYHNNAEQVDGQPGTPATNTRIKLNLPTADALSHYLTGTLSADNAQTIAGTMVNGQEVGQPGLTINTNQVTKLSLVSGSVRFYPGGSTNPVVLPNGQTGDEIITDQGLNIGDINGCWQYAGFVTVDVKVDPAGQPEIVRSKSAVNQSQGGAIASDVNAKPGDVIVYTLTTKNTGNRPAANVAIVDNISDILEYANFVSASDDGQLVGSNVTYASINLNTNETAVRTFSVQVKPQNQWLRTGNLVMSNVYGNRVDVPVEPPAIVAGLSIDKQVKNITRAYDYRNDNTAKQGDIVEFKLVIKNTSSTYVKNVVIKDLLPAGVNFQSGSVRLDRNGSTYSASDDLITTGGFKLDTPLNPNEEITVYLRAKVGTDTSNGQKIRNIGTASADEVGQVSDDANLTIEVESVTTQSETPVATLIGTPTIPTLPITGPADLGLALIASATSGAAGFRYVRAKKALKRASEQIAVL